MLLFAWIGAHSVARRPVLELLQGGAAQPTGKRKPSPKDPVAVLTQEKSIEFHVESEEPMLKAQAPGSGHFAALARYVLRHIRRAPLKSLLTVAVALGFVLALGWMQWTMEKNRATVDHLYDTTVVEADIVQSSSISVNEGAGGIGRAPVEAMMQSGFVQDANLEAIAYRARIGIIQDPRKDYDAPTEATLEAAAGRAAFTIVQDPPVYFDFRYEVRGFDQPATYFPNMLKGISVEYAPGWDESLFTQTWTLEAIEATGLPAVFPENLLKQFDLALGDELYLANEPGQFYTYFVAGQYSGQAFGDQYYYNPPILLPLSGLEEMERSALRYLVAQFTLDPAKNRELPAFKAEMEKMFSVSETGRFPLRIIFWDEELRGVIEPLEKNLALLQVLYPVTIAVSVLIGAGLCLLLVMQNAKDAAILRVLGTPREEVRAMLASEQGLLSLIGLLFGLVGLAVLRQDAAAAFSGPSLLRAGLYLAGALLGAIFGAVSVTRQKPLELLQVKE